MLTLAIFISGCSDNPIAKIGAIRTCEDKKGICEYEIVEHGARTGQFIKHRYEDGAIVLAKKLARRWKVK